MILKYLAFATLSILFTLIFIGGYVSATGVGLSCPDWPMCPAGLVPQEEFIIEYFHRTIAALTGLMVIVTMIFTLKTQIAPRGMKIASIIGSLAVVGQITLGAFVIIERLHAILITIHLGLGITLFSMVLITTLYAWKLDKNKTDNITNKNKSISESEKQY
ncbi:MAG: cytochrome oxidase assembly protein [Nitrososphaeraceae archaeon]|nr:cytochrome oxidase assembly protein [Nitrososphaeraceae archaeon]